ncbi:hypothetical protein BH23PLA1_BH23PLA1_43150 [soil metagenome]
MLQLAGDAGLDQESLLDRAGDRAVGADDLQGHLSPEDLIQTAPDLAHTSLADPIEPAVSRLARRVGTDAVFGNVTGLKRFGGVRAPGSGNGLGGTGRIERP